MLINFSNLKNKFISWDDLQTYICCFNLAVTKLEKNRKESAISSYLSMLLSRRPVRSGRRQVHTSRVTMSILSAIMLTTSAMTWINSTQERNKNQSWTITLKGDLFHILISRVYQKKKINQSIPITYSMIRHLLHCTNYPLNIISLPVSIDYLQQLPTIFSNLGIHYLKLVTFTVMTK